MRWLTQFLKKIFLNYKQMRQLKKGLKIINKTNDAIKSMKDPGNPPPKDIFVKAIETLEHLEKNQTIPENTIKSLEKFKKTCVQAFATILYAEGTIPLKKGDYKKTSAILNELRQLIIKHCEIFEIERSKLIFFLESIQKDFKGNPDEYINIKELNIACKKYQEKAKVLFENNIASIFVEMIVGAMIIPLFCEIADKNKSF